jgi:hypothetical protein
MIRINPKNTKGMIRPTKRKVPMPAKSAIPNVYKKAMLASQLTFLLVIIILLKLKGKKRKRGITEFRKIPTLSRKTEPQ